MATNVFVSPGNQQFGRDWACDTSHMRISRHRCRYTMPHLRDDAPSARKLRRPAALLVATLSSSGKKTIMPGVRRSRMLRQERKISSFGRLQRFGYGRLQRQSINARGFQKTKNKEQRNLLTLIEKQFNRTNAV